jgi:glycosyltransferase involved in cell wall biosynthesis
VQWVPHAYGYRSLNIGFCRWLLHRRKRHADVIDVIVHEPFLPFSVRPTITAAAAVQRVMAWELLRAATRVWVVTPAWERCLRPYSGGRDLGFRWIPVPSTIPVVDEMDTAILRERLRTGALLVGAFGTGDRHAADVWRRSILPLLARDPRINVRLLGRHSHAMRASLLTGTTALADRVHATGVVGTSELSAHLRACDVAIEPYADGICGRHTSAMAFLAHARPLVTTSGRFTEPVWAQSGGVVLVPSNDARGLTHEVTTLLDNPDERMRVGDAGHRLYECRFAIRHTVTALQAVTA